MKLIIISIPMYFDIFKHTYNRLIEINKNSGINLKYATIYLSAND